MMTCAMLLVSGCAAISGNYCDVAQPIWWNSNADLVVTPDSVVRQIVQHNETYDALCK